MTLFHRLLLFFFFASSSVSARELIPLELPFGNTLHDMLLCENGDLVCAGFKRESYHDSIGGRRFYKERYVACMARFRQNGDTVWTAVLPSLGDRSMFFSIVQLSAGRYLLAGRSAMNKGLFCCVEEKGRIVWQKASPFEGELKKIVRKAPNEFLLAGEGKRKSHTLQDCYKMVFLRIDSNGTILHQRLIGPNHRDAWSCAYDVAATSSGYLLAGGLPAEAQTQFALARLDAKGDSAAILFLAATRGHAAFIHALPDGNFIVGGGKSTYNQAEKNAYLVKVNANGDTLWTSSFGAGKGDDAEDLLVLPSGELIAATETGNEDFSLCKLSAQGRLLWEKRVTLSGDQVPARVLRSENKLLVLVRENRKAFLCVTDLNGE